MISHSRQPATPEPTAGRDRKVSRMHRGAPDPVALLFENAGLRIFNKPPNPYLISTVGMLRGLGRVGVIESADAIIHEMTHPSKPDRRPADRQSFTDLPEGVDNPAGIASTWVP